MTAEADEHVLRLDAPVGPERPFEAAADRSGGNGVGGRGGDDPVAAASRRVEAVVVDRGADRHKGGAALHVNEDTIERIAEPAVAIAYQSPAWALPRTSGVPRKAATVSVGLIRGSKAEPL